MRVSFFNGRWLSHSRAFFLLFEGKLRRRTWQRQSVRFGFASLEILANGSLGVTASTAIKGCDRSAEQRPIEPFALFLKGDLAQAEQFAMENGKGVEKREGDQLEPQ